jgi:hypothetical protein
MLLLNILFVHLGLIVVLFGSVCRNNISGGRQTKIKVIRIFADIGVVLEGQQLLSIEALSRFIDVYKLVYTLL